MVIFFSLYIEKTAVVKTMKLFFLYKIHNALAQICLRLVHSFIHLWFDVKGPKFHIMSP